MKATIITLYRDKLTFTSWATAHVASLPALLVVNCRTPQKVDIDNQAMVRDTPMCPADAICRLSEVRIGRVIDLWVPNACSDSTGRTLVLSERSNDHRFV